MEEIKDTETVETAVVEEPVKEETTKTYTKEDIDNSFNAGFKKAKSELAKDEDYKSFQEWKKTNQNDSEKIAELENSNSLLTSENKRLTALIEVNNSDVKKEFSKFVVNEVLSLVNDDTDFDTALKNFKKDNPQYFGEVVVKKVQTSPTLNNGGSKPQTTNDIMNTLLRGE